MSDEGFNDEDILFGIDGRTLGIYDGVIAWVMNDFTVVNRWAGVEGYEEVAARVDEWIDENGAEAVFGIVGELENLLPAEEFVQEGEWV